MDRSENRAGYKIMSEDYSGGPMAPKTRIRRVRMHRDVYNAYITFYHSACSMVQKMDEVLDNAEHKQLISSGIAGGYSMPDVEAVRARNVVIKIYMDGLDPCHDVTERNDIVEVPAVAARQLHLVARHSALMITDVVRNIKQSDYMLWIRNLKEAGGSYDGPTSLQEVFNVWMNLNVSTAYERHYQKGVRSPLPSNWMRCVV